jgi:hypothetical protein
LADEEPFARKGKTWASAISRQFDALPDFRRIRRRTSGSRRGVCRQSGDVAPA